MTTALKSLRIGRSALQPGSKQPPTTSWEARVISAAFVVCVFGLAIATGLNLDSNHSTIAASEKRTSATQIKFDTHFERAFDDHFALRPDLIANLALLRYELFKLPLRNDKVLIGTDGWLYFFDGGDQETIRHQPLLTKEELVSWAKCLEQRQKWLEARHIKFLFVLVPSKCTIYPEYLPPEYTKLNSDSRADQITSYLKTHTKVNFLDLRRPLLAARNQGCTYFKTDSHWNDLGAVTGYNAIAKRLHQFFPEINFLKDRDYTIGAKTDRPGDLIPMIGAPVRIEDYYIPKKPKSQHWTLSKNPPSTARIDQPGAEFATDSTTGSTRKAFFIRDSFSMWLQPLFSETFRRAYFYWSPRFSFPVDQIEKEHPDVVIMEMVERQLARPVPDNPNAG